MSHSDASDSSSEDEDFQSAHSDYSNDEEKAIEKDHEGNAVQTTKVLSDEEIRVCLRDSAELKEEGTIHFLASEWDQAFQKYRSALGRLPKRPRSKAPVDLPPDDTAGQEVIEGKVKQRASPTPENLEPLSELELECRKARSILNGNIGACYVKLEKLEDAVKSCTEALADDPSYIKALYRRATSNDALGTWSSLTSAQEDYTRLQEILEPSDSRLSQIKRALRGIEPRCKAAQKKETDEMMGKLKDLGNSFLGNFGLSTNNFKFEPNGQGGYSMNFVK
ncbi:hypothetical protein SISSUDRAFT_1042979 [Sistotremastrum suecicum HHB10207 ss-3]|uniref:TPR-like protein n=1 Tax=Sistotremastrum suecicum HHB10207 ss-3 TaxID=1314776 RepID=A0A166G7M8_9AGAM|nr:hypothetical protein SISSUDRAFT_1042979 [Sistotremastrum suecicum HHB10207 ss-3]